MTQSIRLSYKIKELADQVTELLAEYIMHRARAMAPKWSGALKDSAEAFPYDRDSWFAGIGNRLNNYFTGIPVPQYAPEKEEEYHFFRQAVDEAMLLVAAAASYEDLTEYIDHLSKLVGSGKSIFSKTFERE